MTNDAPTYDELMSRQDVEFISEADGYRYVKLPPEEHYDNTIWKVDMETNEVSYMAYTEYFAIMDRATYVVGANPKT